ncbi:MAG: S41 family peptidase [Bacteroidetes bacterium]|nr:S41 family peptidase [Bacteroidota bacterium]
MQHNRKFQILLPLLFAIILIIGVFIGIKISATYSSDTSLLQRIATKQSSNDKINQILDYIQTQYVDTINRKQLVDNTLQEVMQQLDPHSAYITAEESKAANEPLQGNFDGIGIEFNIVNDTIRVISPIVGGPSEALGIQPGDKIVKVEGKSVAGVKITNNDVFKKLRGPKGTTVNISVERRGIKKLLDFSIVRNKIPIYSVDVAYMITKEIGYIKISRFAATTFDEYLEAFEKLRKQGMKKMVLDIRGNPGGLLNAAIDLSDEFLSDNKMIVYTEGRAHGRREYKATSSGEFEKNELVVLIDEGSASASEIVAGAIQDNDRGLVVGRRSFGKGLVQEQTDFPDSSAIRLTTARYYTPTGRCIQKSYKKGIEAYLKEEYERFENGELQSADSIKFIDSLKFKTPAGKIVYGGGGIMPDLFVPMDTVGRTTYLTELYYKGVVNQFAFEWADKNRLQLKTKFHSIEQFVSDFEVGDDMLERLVKQGESMKIKKNEGEFLVSKALLKQNIKSLVARNIWGAEGYYKSQQSSDKAIGKAIEALLRK